MTPTVSHSLSILVSVNLMLNVSDKYEVCMTPFSSATSLEITPLSV
jgi:hypothetical protein